jgi:hypothetical protein
MCNSTSAQISGGVIAGTITDSSGAVISGATVTARSLATNVSLETRSDSTGTYRFTNISVGVFDVAVTAPGFQMTQNSSVTVQLQTTTTLNVALRPGAASQTVRVFAGGEQLQTESSDIGTVVSPEMVEDLPLSIGSASIRNAGDFVFLAPAT